MSFSEWLSKVNNFYYSQYGGNWNQNNKNNNKNNNQNQSNSQDENKDENSESGGETGYDFSGLAGILGQATQIGTSFLGKNYNDEGFSDEQAAAKLASNFGPYGQLAAGLANVSSQFTRKLGINASTVSDRAKEAAGLSWGQQIGNRAASLLNNTTFGLFSGFGAITPKTADYNMSQEAQSLSGAYSGSTSDMRAAEDVAGNRFFFGKSKINNLVDNAVKNDDLISGIGLHNQRLITSIPYNAEAANSRYMKSINGTTGQNYSTRVGKQGMKMLSREELDKIYAARKTESDIQKFENGGSIMIPDGKLHAHKHHMEDVNPDLAEDLTKKGIPVVITDGNGEVTQVAEIEKEEIILEKSLTEKIEDLKKDGSEEAMIKAGKLIVDALFNDSTDNAGLINNVE